MTTSAESIRLAVEAERERCALIAEKTKTMLGETIARAIRGGKLVWKVEGK